MPHFEGLPARDGHFLLESGLHAETWLDLDTLFLDPNALKPQIAALANLISTHHVSAVCGPLTGGAFVAQAIALEFGVRFYFSRYPVTQELPMKRTWTIIGVADVPTSFEWYQSLMGFTARTPEHPDFAQILDSDGTVLLCLHEWGVEEHPTLTSADHATPGNGLLLFFRVDDFDNALPRARALRNQFEEEPHMNPNTGTMEFSLRDPDGYFVTISSLDAPGIE